MNYLLEWTVIGMIAVAVVVVKNVVYPIPYGGFYYVIDLLLTVGFGMAAIEVYRTNVYSRIHETTYDLIEQLQKALDMTYDAVYVIDPMKLSFIYTNKAAQHQTGYSKQEMLKMGPLDIQPEYTEAAFREMVVPLADGTEQTLVFDTMQRHRGGQLLPVNVVLRLVRAGRGRSFFVAVAKDVSEQQEIKMQLNESQRLLQLFFEQSLDGIFFMTIPEPIMWHGAEDQEALLEYVMEHQYVSKLNRALAEQYGSTVKKMLGLTPVALFGERISYAKTIWRQMFEEGRLHTMSEERRQDGTPIWVEGDYICLYDDQGRITGHFGIQRDVTELRECL